MKPEDLFSAIGQVEESRLAKSELSLSPGKGGGKKGTSRVLRNLLVAALITGTLAVTAFAAAGYLLFDSPEEMLATIFGDDTGFDHSGGSITPFDDGIGVMIESTFERVPAEEEVVQEDVAPYVSPVGQTISYEDFTLTVDAFLYDSATQCGLLTYVLENPNGLGYSLQSDGEVWFPEGEVLDTNPSGKHYIIQDRSSDTKLTATCYFRHDKRDGQTLDISFYTNWGTTEERMAQMEETEAILEELYQRLRQELTEEEAIEGAKEAVGEENYEEWMKEMSQEEILESSYRIMAAKEYDVLYPEPETETLAISLPEERTLPNVTLADGSICVSPISFRIDVTDLEFLHTGIDGETWVHADNVDSVVIRFRDGTEYIVEQDNIHNNVVGEVSSAVEDDPENFNVLTFIFNRLVDVENISAVIINDQEFIIE